MNFLFSSLWPALTFSSARRRAGAKTVQVLIGHINGTVRGRKNEILGKVVNSCRLAPTNALALLDFDSSVSKVIATSSDSATTLSMVKQVQLRPR